MFLFLNSAVGFFRYCLEIHCSIFRISQFYCYNINVLGSVWHYMPFCVSQCTEAYQNRTKRIVGFFFNFQCTKSLKITLLFNQTTIHCFFATEKNCSWSRMKTWPLEKNKTRTPRWFCIYVLCYTYKPDLYI